MVGRIYPSRISVALRDGLLGGLQVGLKVGLVFEGHFGLLYRLFGGLVYGLQGGLLVWLLYGLVSGLKVGLRFGLIRLFTSEAIPETRFIVNQGTYRSVKMTLSVGLVYGLSYVLQDGLQVGLLGGLFSGGLFSAKHYALRLFLWLSRSAPLNYVAFLNQAKDLLFLRQVGGGYIFTHRLLREYFASLSEGEKELNRGPRLLPLLEFRC